MATRIVESHRKSVLKEANARNKEEKENFQEDIHLDNKIDSTVGFEDGESESWPAAVKRRTTMPNYVTNADGGSLRRRQMRSSVPSQPTTPSHVIARRNERERNRVRQVNESFAVLRSRIPDYLYYTDTDEKGKQSRRKLSKVETLRLAVDYIQQLETLLNIKPDANLDDYSDDDLVSSSDSNKLFSVKNEFESDPDVDAMDLSRDGLYIDEDLSSDVQSPEEKSHLSSFIADRNFSKAVDLIGETKSFLLDGEDRSSDIDCMHDDVEYTARTSPLPNIAQTFPNANIAFPVMYNIK